MKSIDFGDGLARFRVPAHWQEEYEENGGGTFFADDPDAGTLRLSVLTFSKRHKSPPSAKELLSRRAEDSGSEIELLNDGNAMIHYVSDSVEDGEALRMFWWEVATIVDSAYCAIAIFSYTLLAQQAQDERFAAEIEMLDREIRLCTLHPVADA